MALSPVLGAPTPTIPPFDSPVPGSPRIDDWADSARSPRIPRSPMVPAMRIAGRRRSIPHFKRQENGAEPAEDADTVTAAGLLGGLGDTLSNVLHSVGDVAGGLPIIGDLGILSTDGSSPPPQKRDEDADTASAEGLLGSLGDTLSGVLHQIGDVAGTLPIVGDIGLLSTDGSSPPQKRDDADADTASAEGLLGGLGDTLSGVLHQVEGVVNGLPIIGDLGILSADGSDPNAPPPQKRDGPPDQVNALRQQITALLLQQQQAQQAASILSAASAGLPVNANDLEQRLLALQGLTQPVLGNLQGLAGGLPIAGPLVSNTLASAGDLAGGLPLIGGLLGGNGILGGLLGQGGLGDLTGTATGLVGGLTGGAGGLLGGALGGGGILQNVLGGGSPTSQAFASANQAQWPDATGFYPHSLVNGAPAVPPNSPASSPSSILYQPFAMNAGDLTPPVPPPSPASSVASIPMAHDTASHFFASPTSMTSFMPAPSSVPSMVLNDALGRRRVDGVDTVVQKRSDPQPVPEDDMHEGGPDAVPGPQDQLDGVKTAPSSKIKMFRRLIRGASVSF
ncbi:hypothetical protein M408DRAFT_327196 [Serendipita vermifera MAFF 305830]|uniref:Uncharacterized protein n=1 Tax=Serendipita vermifera MAFF 305830 TaxID=933852 RepID=A0A0C3BI10_SERVB|nr:hypothetical protein M408DRAFT_327196 [Serendipita vermifera MAFF 305830]